VRPFAPGREVVPGVRVIGLIHRSNVLDVYDAWSPERACRVALKVPRPDRLRDRGAAAALLREGRLLRRLTHPHLVRAYEVHAGPRPAVVLETLPGETLARLVARRRLSAAELAHLGVQLAGALRHLHRAGVLHLDLKPQNVIADAGRAKVIDLSLARAPGRMPAGRGTWCNLAPEQARGGEVGPAADVWGLGLVLHEAATGANPFHDHPGDEEFPQLAIAAPPVRTLRRLPAALAGLVDACLAPDPADRPALDDVLAALMARARPDAPPPAG
jgi:serine/threonine protein kinase